MLQIPPICLYHHGECWTENSNQKSGNKLFVVTVDLNYANPSV
jgi:hypothetical protein